MTVTTSPPQAKLPEIASRLHNGAWVLAAKHINEGRQVIVLGFSGGAGASHVFTTWEISAQRPGFTYSGHYFHTLGEAVADYAERG